MKASFPVGHFAGRSQKNLAAASAIAGVTAGVLGNLLTNHWQWGTLCGLLVLTAFLAAAAWLNARHEENRALSPVVNSPARGLPYIAINYRDTYGPNASVGNRYKTVYRNRATTINFGGFQLPAFIALIVAIIALVIAVGGTIYINRNPGLGALQGPAALAAEGGHGAPEAAVAGFFGNAFQNNWARACSYEPPGEQDACRNGISLGVPPEAGSMAVGRAIIEGTRALVPVSGKLCRYGECRTFQGTGIPQGYTFQTAYHDAYDSPDSSANLVPCREAGNKWYVLGLNP